LLYTEIIMGDDRGQMGLVITMVAGLRRGLIGKGVDKVNGDSGEEKAQSCRVIP
jgi:hypothetical protein